MTAQLAFDLPARASLRRADFFVSPANALALATVEAATGWPLGKLAISQRRQLMGKRMPRPMALENASLAEKRVAR